MNRRRGGEYGAAGGRKSQVRIQEQWMDGSHSHLGPPCPLEPGTVVQYTARGGRASKTSDDAAEERSFPLLTRESTRLPGRRWMSGGNLEGRTTKLSMQRQQPLLVLILKQSRAERWLLGANQTKVFFRTPLKIPFRLFFSCVHSLTHSNVG